MNELNQFVLESEIVDNEIDVFCFVEFIGFFVIIRFVYILGGKGGGIVFNKEVFIVMIKQVLLVSLIN